CWERFRLVVTECQVMSFSSLLKLLELALDHSIEVTRDGLDGKFAGTQARHIEQVGDKPYHALTTGVGLAQGLLDRFGDFAEIFVHNHADIALDRCKWSTELVGGHTDEIVFGVIEGNEFIISMLELTRRAVDTFLQGGVE